MKNTVRFYDVNKKEKYIVSSDISTEIKRII